MCDFQLPNVLPHNSSLFILRVPTPLQQFKTNELPRGKKSFPFLPSEKNEKARNLIFVGKEKYFEKKKM